jgi:hypothetical protein
MVAATYGSAAVVSLLLGLSYVDVNRRPGVDGATALHCAASGGSRNAVAVVKLFLAAGADPVTPDSAGRIPADVILAPPGLPDALGDLEILLGRRRGLAVTTSVPSGSSSPPLSSSPDDGNRSPSSRSSSLSPIMVDRGRKEYLVDPTLPDIKSSVYASDEFRMFAFKVRPCSRAYSHDWTECPFVHPGEMLAAVTLASTRTLLCLAPTSADLVVAPVVTAVSSPMVYLRAGFTHLSTALGSARKEQRVPAASASSPMMKLSSAMSLTIMMQVCYLPEPPRLLI